MATISNSEKEFSKILNRMIRQGKIKSYKTQVTITVLPKDSKYKLKAVKYTPDFVVEHNDGSLEYIEIKGAWHYNKKGKLIRPRSEAFMLRWKIFKRWLLNHERPVRAMIVMKDNLIYEEFNLE